MQVPSLRKSNQYSVAGTDRHTIASTAGGCDAAAVLNLVINTILTDTTNATVCTSQLPYIWNGNPYSVAGTYRDTIASTTGGCDTAAVLNLVINTILPDTTNATVCTSQLPYIWNGNPYSIAGTYRDTIASTTGGCDTAAVLNLAINTILTDTTNATVCTSQLPYIWNGNPYTIAGTYRDTIASTTGGCDTAALLKMVINPILSDTSNETAFSSQLPYIWNGNPYSIAGTYRDTIASTTGGCDTAAVLNLVINTILTDTTNATVCTSQLPYIWNGNQYNIAGTYRDTIAS